LISVVIDSELDDSQPRNKLPGQLVSQLFSPTCP